MKRLYAWFGLGPIDFDTASIRRVTRFINKRRSDDYKIVNYIDNTWGHSCSVDGSRQDNRMRIIRMHGHHSGSKFIGGRRLRVGDIILKKVDDGMIGEFFILEIKFEDNPWDLYFGYMTCIGKHNVDATDYEDIFKGWKS